MKNKIICGIYCIYWEEPDLIYIGKSVNIVKRWNEHINSLKRKKHHNYKMQNVFDNYGVPNFYILEEANSSSLDIKEIYWISEFDSISKGLNLNEGGKSCGYGPNSSNATHSRLEVLLAFRALRDSSKSIPTISKELNLGVQFISHILKGTTHLWLKEKYPYLYNLVQLRRAERGKNVNNLSRFGESPRYFKSSEGIIYKVENMTQFAKEHNCDVSALTKVWKEKAKSHKGFTKYVY